MRAGLVLRDCIAIEGKKLTVVVTLEADNTAVRSVEHCLDHGDSGDGISPGDELAYQDELSKIPFHDHAPR